MKTSIEIRMEKADGTKFLKTIIGNKHTIKLCTGEKIKVVAHKEEDCDFWHITDIDTGLNLVPPMYYGFIEYDSEHDIFTENNALKTVKFVIDRYLTDYKMTFKQMKEKRFNEVSKDEK